jgi:hypothetical protein
MSKVRDQAAEKQYGKTYDTLAHDGFKAGWDECLRSEPRLLALVEALELLPCLVIKISGGFGDADKIKHSHDCLKCKALAAFKETK